jgi:hypothetical protein
MNSITHYVDPVQHLFSGRPDRALAADGMSVDQQLDPVRDLPHWMQIRHYAYSYISSIASMAAASNRSRQPRA